MAALSKLTDVLGFVLPKGKGNPTGVSATGTFNPSNAGQVLSAPAYRDHIEDLLTERSTASSQDLLQKLIKFDPDVSAAVNSYLTVANQKLKMLVYDQKGQLDSKGQTQLMQLLQFMTGRNDYTLGFQINQSLYGLSEQIRYMILMRGGCGAELVVNKNLLPTEIRLVDPKSLEWVESTPGQYKPAQAVPGSQQSISLDIPTFFMTWFRKDPTNIYTYSPFVSVINTVAARTQIVNDLYRIMQVSGYPRLHIKVLEEVIIKSAPPDVKIDNAKLKTYVNDRFSEIRAKIAGLRVDESFVSTDAVEATTLNADAPGMSINIDSVIEVLNGQNQAALKVMATLIGRGDSGVNTASVEATIFAFNADSLNEPIAELYGNILTLMMRLQGFNGYVDVEFEKVELRSELELEPQRLMKQQRLLELLSIGAITDNEFHLEMFGRPKPDGIDELSGTGFMTAGSGSSTASNASPNADPMGRAVTPNSSSKAAKSKSTPKPNVARTDKAK